MSIEATKNSFEESFQEATFYNKQTQDESHLRNILKFIQINPRMKVLNLGCGSGYLTFSIAKENPNVNVIGLDIVTTIIANNTAQAAEDALVNLEYCCFGSLRRKRGRSILV